MNATAALPRNERDDYATLRSTVGAYPVTAPLVRISGDDRLSLLDQFMAKSSEFVEPDTVREVLSLNADGTPFAVLLHFEMGEDSWLLPRTQVTAEALRTYVDGLDVPAGVTVEIAPEGWGATAFEGPQAWAVGARFVDFDISGLTLHAVTEAALPGDPDAVAHMARVGTTGEYGYLLISNAPAAAHEAVVAHVEEQGGAVVGAEGLARVQAEALHGRVRHRLRRALGERRRPLLDGRLEPARRVPRLGAPGQADRRDSQADRSGSPGGRPVRGRRQGERRMTRVSAPSSGSPRRPTRKRSSSSPSSTPRSGAPVSNSPARTSRVPTARCAP